jgi:glycosyltransferase involved in cell wall biosynthesis
VLAGSSPPQANEVDEFLSGLGAWERQRIIRIEEFPEQEKASIYDSFDIVALPSTSESFGIVYLEAWLCGKPVIGSRIGSTQSVIEENVDGLLASPDDPFDLARAIVELLSNPEKRERLGKRGQAKTLARYTWDKVTEKVERIYLDLYTIKASAPSSSIHRKKHILSPGFRPPE